MVCDILYIYTLKNIDILKVEFSYFYVKNLYFRLRNLINMYFNNYLEIFPKISGSERNFDFIKASFNLENTLFSKVYKYKERFSKSLLTRKIFYIFRL